MMSTNAIPSRAASTLIGAAPLCLFAGERVLVDGAGRVVFLALAATGIVLGTVLRFVERSRADADAKGAALLGLVPAVLAMVCGALWILRARMGSDDDASSMAVGVLHMGAVIAGVLTVLTAAAFELAISPMREARVVEVPRLRSALSSSLAVGLVFFAVGFLNYAVNAMDWRRDFAMNAPTAPSDATFSLLDAAENPVEIILFFERGSPVLTELGDYFDAMRIRGAKIETLDHAFDPKLATELKVSRNGTIAVRSGTRNETWHVGTERDQAQRKLKKIDEEIRTRISKVTRDPKTIAFTSGHGERDIRTARPGDRPGVALMKKLAEQVNAKVETIGIAKGLTDKVPDDVSVVVVAGPTSSFQPEEARALANFVDDGGALFLLLDPGVDAGLGPVLEKLGIEVSTATLANETEFVRKSRTKADHGFLFSSSFTSHKAVKALAQARGQAALLLLESARLVDVHAKSKAPGDGLRRTALVRSRAGTFDDKDGDRTFDEATETKGVVELAFAIEADKKAQSTDADDASTTKSFRGIVVGDSDVVSDLLLGNDANQVFAYEALLWLLKDDAAGGAVVTDDDVPIRHTRDGDTAWFYGTVLGGPVAVLVVGLLFVRRRRRRGR